MSEFSSSPEHHNERLRDEQRSDSDRVRTDLANLDFWHGADRPAFSPQALECMSSIQQLTRDLGMHLAGIEEISRLQHQLERQKSDMQRTIETLYERIASLEDRLDGSIAS
ncbi:MAG: hypothetical protein AAFY15_03960 [Cyanobacteria bacterium J06648_11]